jgi:hypothetical protein
MTCEEAELLMLSVPSDAVLSADESAALESHLATCPKCAAEFERFRSLVGKLQLGWESLPSPAATDAPTPDLSAAPVEQARLHSAEDGWRDLIRRQPDLAEAVARREQERWSRRLFSPAARIAAMAACILLIFAATWTVLSKQFRSTHTSRTLATTSPTHNSEPRFLAQAVTPNGLRDLPSGQPIVAGANRQEILLGGIHRVVMRPGTSATFGMAQTGAYDVVLSSGRIYVEVVPGNPFTVHTDNALLTITGTKFDVTADSLRTDLVLLKGSIRFSGKNHASITNVSAGFASTVRSGSAPSQPVPVDAATITAWARGLAGNTGPATTRGHDDVSDSLHTSWRQSKAIDVESLDYAKWRDEHREWFATAFPSTFVAQTTLATRGIHADYVDLLMISGQLWQFHYRIDPSARTATMLDGEQIKKIATWYQVDPASLRQSGDNGEVGTTSTDGADDFRRWQVDMAAAVNHPSDVPSGLLAITLEASIHLANTRTAAYLWVKSHPQDAQRLLDFSSDQSQLSGLMLSSNRTYSQLRERLLEQFLAAQEVKSTAQDLLTAEAGADCQCQSQSLHQLQSLLSKLAPPILRVTTRTEGRIP